MIDKESIYHPNSIFPTTYEIKRSLTTLGILLRRKRGSIKVQTQDIKDPKRINPRNKVI
jgi:hypothetical protein